MELADRWKKVRMLEETVQGEGLDSGTRTVEMLEVDPEAKALKRTIEGGNNRKRKQFGEKDDNPGLSPIDTPKPERNSAWSTRYSWTCRCSQMVDA